MKYIKIFLILSILMLTGCKDPEQQIDFQQEFSDNLLASYLICPPDYCELEPNEISFVFPFKVDHLELHWRAVINQQSNIKLIEENTKKLQFTYMQTTKYLNLPYTINVILIALDKNHSTIAIYSKAKYHYLDLRTSKSIAKNLMQDLINSVGKQHKI